MSYWKQTSLTRPDAPYGPGVYVILVDGVVVYVGQSMRLRERLHSHKFRPSYGKSTITPWGDIDDEHKIILKFKESRRIGDWAMWEIRLIHRLQPIHNKTHLKLRRAA